MLNTGPTENEDIHNTAGRPPENSYGKISRVLRELEEPTNGPLAEKISIGDNLTRQSKNVLKDAGRAVRLIARMARARCSVPDESGYLDNPENFKRLSEPRILEGEHVRNPVLCFGGLGSTGQGTWNELAEVINDSGRGPRVEIYSLAGHDGSWDGMVQASWGTWVEDILSKARALYELTGRQVVFQGLSTGALAGAAAMAIEPELFAGGVFVGAPFDLKRRFQKTALKFLEKEYRSNPDSELWKRLNVPVPSYGSSKTRDEQNSPSFTRIPVKVFVELRQLMEFVADYRPLAALKAPVLVLQGLNDALVDPDGTRAALERVEDRFLEEHTVENGVHNLLLGPHKHEVIDYILGWRGGALQDELKRKEVLRHLTAQVKERVKMLRDRIDQSTTLSGDISLPDVDTFF